MPKKRGGGGRKSYYKKKFFFSIRERILLHLSEFGMYENEVEAPDELTQFGIAETVRAGRSTCSKLLQEMEDKGLLYGRRAHVPSGKIRRTVYFLTPRGQMEAQKIRRKLERTTVKVKRPSGEEEKLKVVDIPKEIPVYARLVDVVCAISRGVFDVEKFVKRMKAKRKKVAFVATMPRLRHFFDRNGEMEAIEAWWDTSDGHIMALHGLPGVGKTTLAGKAVSNLKEDHSVFWYRFYEWSTLRDVLRQTGDFLARLNHKDLYNYVDTHEKLDMTEVFLLLEKHLRDLRALLVFDDYDKAEGDLDGFFTALKDLVERVNGPKLLVVSRTLPKFYDRRDVKVRKVVQEMELEGLDRDGAATLLTLKNIPEEEVDAVYRKTQGHPLFLELLQGPDVADTEDIDAFLRQEVFDRLLDVERRTLGLASVFRRPIPSDALFLDDDVDFVVLTSLTDQSLLRETIPRIYDMHDVLRDFFYRQLTPSLQERYHRWAARFYTAQGKPEDLVEAQFHYLRGGDPGNAAELAQEHGRDIIGKGFLEEFAHVLEELREADLDPSVQLEVRVLEGRVADVRGEWDEAEAAYRKAAEEAGREGVTRVEARARHWLGALLLARGEYEQVEEELNASLRLFGKLKDTDGQAEVYYSIGFLRNRNSEFMEAYRNFRKGYRLVHEEGDPAIIADLLFAFGVNYGQRGNYKKAISYKSRALSILEGLRDLRQLAKVYTGLGVSHHEMGNLDEALAFYQRGLEFARLIGDKRVEGYALQNMAGICIERNRVADAEKLVLQAMDIFSSLGERRKIAWSLLYQGDIHYYKGEMDRAKEHWSKGFEELHALKDLRGVALFNLVIARLHIEVGDVAQAGTYLNQAERAAREIGHEAVLQDITEERDRIEALRKGEEVPERRGLPGPAPG